MNHKFKTVIVGVVILALNMGADKECEDRQRERATGIKTPDPKISCRKKVQAVMQDVPTCETDQRYQMKVVGLSTWEKHGLVEIRWNSSGKWEKTTKEMPFGDTGETDPGNEFPGVSRPWTKIVSTPKSRAWVLTARSDVSRDTIRRTLLTCQIVYYGGDKDGDIVSNSSVNMATRGGFIDCEKPAGK